MRRLFALSAVATAALALAQGGLGADARDVSMAAAREVVVTLPAGSSTVEARRTADGLGGVVIDSIPQLDAYLVRLDGRLARRASTAARSVGENSRDRIDGLPTDSLRGLQWSLDAIGVEALWQRTLGDPGVIIAIVDTGIDYAHTELAGRVVLGPDLANGDDDPIDTQGHGTAVAALAGAADDGDGIVGVCPRCTLMAVKVAPDGSGEITKFVSAAGIVWAVDHGADVVNLSFGGTDPDAVQRDAVAYALARGAVVVASAGNRGNSTRQYPAAYDGVIAVGASDRNDRPAPLTSFGPWVDLAAPGTMLLAPALTGGAVPRTGTSFATPLVSATVALVSSLLSAASAGDRTTALLAGTVPLRPPLYGRDRPLARGRLDVPTLLAKLGALGSPTPTIARLMVPLAVEGRRFTVRAAVLRDDTGSPLGDGTITCAARLGHKQLTAVRASLSRGSARCTWRLPAGSRGRVLVGRVAVAAAGFEVRQPFTAPVHRA